MFESLLFSILQFCAKDMNWPNLLFFLNKNVIASMCYKFEFLDLFDMSISHSFAHLIYPIPSYSKITPFP